MAKYEVLREMQGDKDYKPGDTRELSEGDAKHLVDCGVLRKVSTKAAPRLKNKADRPPENK
jgi:transketolase C-terminal domain/subunit